MARHNKDVFLRLQGAMTDWHRKVTDAHLELARQLSSAQEFLESLATTITESTLNAGNSALDAAFTKAQARIEELAHSMDDKNAAAKEEMQQAMEAMAEREKEITGTRSAIETLQNDLADRDARLAEVLSNLEELRQELASRETDLSITRESMRTAHEDAETARKAADLHTEELAGLTSELELTRVEFSRVSLELEELNSDKQKCEVENRRMKHEVESLRTGLDQVRNELDQARATLSEGMEKQEESMRQFYLETQDRLVEARMNAEAAAREAQQRVEEFRTEATRQAERAAELQARLDADKALQAERERAIRAEIESSHVQIEHEKTEAQNALRTLKSDVETLRMANASLLRAQEKPIQADTPEADSTYEAIRKKRRLGEVLVNSGLVNELDLQEALLEQTTDPKRRLGAILIERGLVDEIMLAQVLATQLRLPFMRLDPQDAAPEAVRMLNPKMARRHVCVPIRADDDTITLAMANPLDLVAIEDLVRVSERRVNVVVAPESEILAAIPQ